MNHRAAATHPASLLRYLLCAWYLAVFGVSAYAFSAPTFRSDVLDETGTLSQEQQAALKQRIRDLRTQDGIWAAVYFTKDLQGGSIEEAAVDTFEKWKLGEKGKDNGVLVIVAPSARKMRIEVGYGLEGTLTDLSSKRIIEDIYKPAFRDNRYADGLTEGFDYMSRLMRKEVPTEEIQPPAAQEETPATVEIDWGRALLIFFSVWLANLCVPVLFWLYRRIRSKPGTDGKVKMAFALFAFIGFIFALFTAIFTLDAPGDPNTLLGILGMNSLFGLFFLIPLLLGAGSSGSGGGGSSGSDSWSSSSSSSSGSSSSDSSSSSDGGSSGGGGSSGNY